MQYSRSFQDVYLSLLASSEREITADEIANAIATTGLQLDRDIRLKSFFAGLNAARGKTSLDQFEVSELMAGDGGMLAMNALEGNLAIPDFQTFSGNVRSLFQQVANEDPVGAPIAPPSVHPRLTVFDASYNAAQNADYIPALSIAEDGWGVSICTVHGQRLSLGDSDRKFSIQSCCKPINYCQALESLNISECEQGRNVGGDESPTTKARRLRERAECRKVNRFESIESEEQRLGVHDYVDCEPSGDPFNHFSFNRQGMPFNPMINAGALMCSALIGRARPTDIELEQVQRTWAKLAGTKQLPMPDTKTAKGESRTGANNRSLAYKMFANEAFPAFVQSNDHLENVLDFYFHSCALMMTANELAVAAAALANRGICPTTGQRVFRPETVTDALASMLHCGMYDSSGRFGRLVGLPAKSGVGGGIMLIVPGVMGICTFSPRLDKIGNSSRGLRLIELMLEHYALHMLDATYPVTAIKANPTVSPLRQQSEPVHAVMSAATLCDVAAFVRFENESRDRESYLQLLNRHDYDGRTPLHLAVCEGHLEVVRYLLKKGVNHSSVDRWGSTPLDDACRLDWIAIRDWLMESGAVRHQSPEISDSKELFCIRDQFEESEKPHRSNCIDDLEQIWAAAAGDLDHLRRTAARGGRILVADYDDRTTVHLAAAEQQFKVLEFLVRFLTEASRQSEFATPRVAYVLSWPDRWGTTPMDELNRRNSTDPIEVEALDICRKLMTDAGAMTGSELADRLKTNEHQLPTQGLTPSKEKLVIMVTKEDGERKDTF